MVRAATIIVTLATAGIFAWAVPLDRLFDAFPSLTTALSIIIGALLVRLSRGMPTLDWKTVPVEKRARLTTGVLALAREYVVIVCANGSLLVVLICLSAIGKTQTLLALTLRQQQAVAAGIGLLVTLCVARMVYVIWRDFDIVRLQKEVIDTGAADELRKAEAAKAEVTTERIRASRMREEGSPET